MGEVNTHASNVRLIGGRICLDFINTVDSHLKPAPKEYLRGYAELLIWAQHAESLDAAQAEVLHAAAAQRPAEAEALRLRAVTLRGALYRLFAGMIGGQAPVAADLAEINAALAAAPARAQIAAGAAGLEWQVRDTTLRLDRVLWPVIWSAGDLLTSPERVHVRQCAGPGCSWLFLDLSRNRSRRWCSMEDCGNRAKARRHYQRAGGP